MRLVVKRLCIDRVGWCGEPATYEVRKPMGVRDWGERVAVFESWAEAISFANDYQAESSPDEPEPSP